MKPNVQYISNAIELLNVDQICPPCQAPNPPVESVRPARAVAPAPPLAPFLPIAPRHRLSHVQQLHLPIPIRPIISPTSFSRTTSTTITTIIITMQVYPSHAAGAPIAGGSPLAVPDYVAFHANTPRRRPGKHRRRRTGCRARPRRRAEPK